MRKSKERSLLSGTSSEPASTLLTLTKPLRCRSGQPSKLCLFAQTRNSLMRDGRLFLRQCWYAVSSFGRKAVGAVHLQHKLRPSSSSSERLKKIRSTSPITTHYFANKHWNNLFSQIQTAFNIRGLRLMYDRIKKAIGPATRSRKSACRT